MGYGSKGGAYYGSKGRKGSYYGSKGGAGYYGTKSGSSKKGAKSSYYSTSASDNSLAQFSHEHQQVQGLLTDNSFLQVPSSGSGIGNNYRFVLSLVTLVGITILSM